MSLDDFDFSSTGGFRCSSGVEYSDEDIFKMSEGSISCVTYCPLCGFEIEMDPDSSGMDCPNSSCTQGKIDSVLVQYETY